MKTFKILLVCAAIGVVAFPATPGAAKTCKRDYYTGEGGGKTWQVGERNAHGDWSRIVRNNVGKSWRFWSKAKVRDESCDPVSAYFQWCVVEAYPCR
jgi:hypothetical protein